MASWSFIPTQDCLPLLFLSHKKNTSLISVSYQLFNLLPFIFSPANPPLVDTTFNLRAAAGITEAFRFYEKVLSKLKAVIKGGIFFPFPILLPTHKTGTFILLEVFGRNVSTFLALPSSSLWEKWPLGLMELGKVIKCALLSLFLALSLGLT